VEHVQPVTELQAAGSAIEDVDELELVEDDLVIEDVSIDGMCGVY
jgi:mycofactocin precursor